MREVWHESGYDLQAGWLERGGGDSRGLSRDSREMCALLEDSGGAFAVRESIAGWCMRAIR